MKTKHLKTGLTLLFSMALASQSVMHNVRSYRPNLQQIRHRWSIRMSSICILAMMKITHLKAWLVSE